MPMTTDSPALDAAPVVIPHAPDVRDPRALRFSRVATAFLGYTLFVVLWGALVRATLSGDGCGDHWPLCNGDVVPPSPRIETLVELTHRITSGFCWIGALLLIPYSRRVFPPGHPARRGAAFSFLWMTTEALVGAGLVLLRLVADNPSLARGWWMAAHLLNTFLLLAALTLTVWYARTGAWIPLGRRAASWALALLGVLLLGMSGAIAALGDTLFPATSLADGLRQDFSPSAHLFLRLRTLHPLLALGVGAFLLYVAGAALADTKRLDATAARERVARDPRRPAIAVIGLLVLQMGAGLLNLALLAPVWLQLVHLLIADLLWIALIVLAAAALTRPGAQQISI